MKDYILIIVGMFIFLQWTSVVYAQELGPYSYIPSYLQRDQYSGLSSRGEEIVPFPRMERPGLAGFYFEYASGEDEKVMLIGAQQSWPPSVTVGFSPENPYAIVGGPPFPDPLPSYFWEIHRQQLPSGTSFFTHSYCSEDEDTFVNYDYHIRSMENDGVPVLVGFRLFKKSSTNMSGLEIYLDKHYYGRDLDSIHPIVDINVSIHDKDYKDDGFCYVVSWGMVPERKVVNVEDTGYRHYIEESESVEINAKHPVLQGFSFIFHSADQELNKLGLIVTPNNVDATFSDNDKNEFQWRARYVDVIDWKALPRPFWKGGQPFKYEPWP